MPDPLWINCPATGGPQYTAAELRQDMAFGGLWSGRSLGARQGRRPGGTQWDVTLSGSTITVWAGVGLVDPGLSLSQGPYWVSLPQNETQTLVAAHATSPRKDIVTVQVYDADEDASGLRTARSEYVAGIAAPTPSEPAVPAGAVKIATIDVPAQGGGSPVVTMNAPYTVAPGGVLPVRTAAEQAAVTLYAGLLLYRLDLGRILSWDGSAIRTVGPSIPVQNAVSTAETTNSTTYTNLPTVGPTVGPITLLAGQKVLVIIEVGFFLDTSPAGARGVASFAVSGAETIAAADADGIQTSLAVDVIPGTKHTVFTATSGGSYTFQMKYKVIGSVTCTFSNRRLIVVPFS